VEAFPDIAHYLLRDRDAIYGTAFQQRVSQMGIEEVKIAPRSPGRIHTAKEPSAVFDATPSTM
jgi:hypothetical protein